MWIAMAGEEGGAAMNAVLSFGPSRTGSFRPWVREAAALAIVALFAPAAVHAQEESAARRNAVVSDLAQDNLRHVAASAEQIRAVLQAQPGLLVELKRWAAKDAADLGQVVSAADLADEAIYDRLASDAEFRAVATKLLERYGYLIPKASPGSEAAKEQEVLLEARLRALNTKIDQQEQTAQTPLEGATTNAPRARREQGTATGAPLVGPGPAPEPPLRSPEEAEPAVPGEQRPKLTQTTANLPERPAGTAESWENSEQASRIEWSAANAEMAERASGSSVVPESGASPPTESASAKRSPERGNGPSEHFGTVRLPNPYADIPSLYDMYRQAAHPGQLGRFGLEVFSQNSRPELLPMDLPVGPDYVVGPGDGLAIDLWGSVSQRLYRNVDREGRLALPEVGPLLVSGKSLAEVQSAVQQILRTQFRDIGADVSLSRLRTIRVYVVGDVDHPGAYDISSLSTPLNALFAAGGPTERGSLRLLRHYRGKQLIEDVDVYDLLLHGVRAGMERLENGDTVLVPPLGAQVTVEGMVRRPSVYELRGEKNLAEVLELAGGILPAATLRHIEVERLEAHAKRTMLSLDVPEGEEADSARRQLESFAIQNDDDVRIFPIAPYNQDAVYLEGHVLRPGRYSFRAGMKLTDLVASYKDLLPEPAEKYAEIIRLNPPDFRPSVESFDLAAALANPAAAPTLEPLDTIRIFSRFDFQNPPFITVLGEVRAPGSYRTAGQIHLRDAIQLAGGLAPDAQMDTAQVFELEPDSKLKILSINLREALAGNPLDNILLEPRDRIVVHRNPAKVDPASVTIEGEVAHPGHYPLTMNLRVADLVRVAGGLKRSANAETADLTHYAAPGTKPQTGEHETIQLATALSGDAEHNMALHDGDVLTIPQVSGWNDVGATVSVSGEVAHPGTYGIRPGERLSSVLERAGGFLPTADPRAAVFERKEVRQLQEQSRQELIRRIEQEAASFKTSLNATAQEQATTQQTALQQRERTITALQHAPVTGRLVIHIGRNLTEFARSTDNVEMRSGDSILIPKRPNFVLVTGQVYNSNAITFTPRRDAAWYLAQAGGPTGLAEKKAVFIVRANGAVVTAQGGWWTGNVLSRQVQPGDVIVVPEKAVGGSSSWKNLLGLAQIAQSASVTALVVTR